MNRKLRVVHMRYSQISLAKRPAGAADRRKCGKALDIAGLAGDMHRGNGIWEEFQLMRHMGTLDSVNGHEGGSDVAALIPGRAQRGLQARS